MSFQTLGLAAGADEREVRRAYARLLKTTRPDDDPVAFQALHEAYQACLQQIRDDRWHAEEEALEQEAEVEADAIAAHGATLPLPGERVQALPEPVPMPVDRPAAAPQAADEDEDDGDAESLRFDFGGFMQALLEQAQRSNAAALSAWLYSLPDLYSIQLKSAITVDVLRIAVQHEPPISADRLRAIGEFFGVHQLGPRDWWLVERMEQAQQRADLHERFRRGELPRSGQVPPRAIDLMMDTELARPRWSWRMLPLTLVPMLPTRTRDRILELDELSNGLSEQLIEPRRRAWFTELADRSAISLKRLGLSVLRTLLFGSLFLLLHLLLIGSFGSEMLVLIPAIGGAILVWQLLMAAYLKFKRALAVRGLDKYLREGLVLAFAVGALVSGAFGAGLLPYSLAIGAVFYAAARHRAMEGGLTGLLLGVADAVLTAPEGVTWPFPPGISGLCLAACLVLALDRFRAWRTGLPLQVVIADGKWLRSLAGTCFVAVAIGFAALIAVTSR